MDPKLENQPANDVVLPGARLSDQLRVRVRRVVHQAERAVKSTTDMVLRAFVASTTTRSRPVALATSRLQTDDERIDEAGRDSFPASDAPPWTSGVEPH